MREAKLLLVTLFVYSDQRHLTFCHPTLQIISSQENASPNRGGAPEPQLVPPQPPRSAFMCFTDAKKKELLGSFNNPKDKEEILNTVATEWRLLSDRDRAYWDEVARNDKVRYVALRRRPLI